MCYAKSMAKHTVLVIDDNPTIRDLYQQRFREAGFHVYLATNGDEGLKTALAKRPEAILLDVMMPVKGGLGTLEVLKTMPETRDIPVIVLTAYPADEYRQKSGRSGAAAFISKSETTPGDIVKRVQELIGA